MFDRTTTELEQLFGARLPVGSLVTALYYSIFFGCVPLESSNTCKISHLTRKPNRKTESVFVYVASLLASGARLRRTPQPPKSHLPASSLLPPDSALTRLSWPLPTTPFTPVDTHLAADVTAADSCQCWGRSSGVLLHFPVLVSPQSATASVPATTSWKIEHHVVSSRALDSPLW